MRLKHHVQVCSAILTVLILCTLFSHAAQVSAQSAQVGQSKAQTSVNANVYLTNALLQPLFQSDLNTQLPQAMSQTIAGMVNQMPQQDQAWATQMANALLQPTATLLSIVPQPNGLLAIFNVSLYPGDPQITTTSLAIGFRVVDASTIQVTALPASNGQQSLLSGPLTTMHLSIGTLNTITPMPNCGDADLNVNLQFPLALGQSSTTLAANPHPIRQLAVITNVPVQQPVDTSKPTAYIELPAASLAQLGTNISSLAIDSNFTATNIRLGVQGNNLMLTTDILWHGFGFGTAVSTLTPSASHSNLVMHVQNTNLQLINGLINFPVNNYNQQIEQAVNAKLNGALTNTFTVTQAEVGGNASMPCVSSTSLLLAGMISLH